MKIVPFIIRTRPALPELMDQINKHLSSKRLPHIWKGGRRYSEDYEIVLGAPGGNPTSIPLHLVYRQGQKDEQIIDEGWRLPLVGKLSVLYETETPPPAAAPASSPPDPQPELISDETPAPEPEPEPAPKKSRKKKSSENE